MSKKQRWIRTEIEYKIDFEDGSTKFLKDLNRPIHDLNEALNKKAKCVTMIEHAIRFYNLNFLLLEGKEVKPNE